MRISKSNDFFEREIAGKPEQNLIKHNISVEEAAQKIGRKINKNGYLPLMFQLKEPSDLETILKIKEIADTEYRGNLTLAVMQTLKKGLSGH